MILCSRQIQKEKNGSVPFLRQQAQAMYHSMHSTVRVKRFERK